MESAAVTTTADDHDYECRLITPNTIESDKTRLQPLERQQRKAGSDGDCDEASGQLIVKPA